MSRRTIDWTRLLSRAQIIARRWLSLIACGAVAGLLTHLLWPIIDGPLAVAVARLGMLPPSLLLMFAAIVVAVGSWRIARGRWLGAIGIRHPATYPPLTVAVIAGVAMLAILQSPDDLGSQPLSGARLYLRELVAIPFWAWVLALAILVVPCPLDLAPVIADRRKRHRLSSRRGPRAPASFQELREWLRTDDEVEDPSQDRFHADTVARRIAAHLSEGEAPTIALVGPLGSGKSTIKRFAGHHLQGQLKIEVVDISLWPFDSPEAAVKGILDALIRTLGRRANILGITGLAESYVEAIERASERWGAFGRFLRGSAAPDDVLKQISEVAQAIDVRFVLWIEDMERFAGTTALGGDEAASREAERLGAVRALLYQLDRSDSISVLISDTSLQTRFDVDKIARFVERPPPLDSEDVAKQLDILRNGCLNGWPRKIIDPVPATLRQRFARGEDESPLSLWIESVRSDRLSLQRAVVVLIETPRSLKTVLRTVVDTWNALAGEIDIDDVLIATAIRIARPALFAFMDKYIELFRSGFRDPLGGGRSQSKEHPRRADLEKLLRAEPTEPHRHAIELMIRYLFPEALAEHAADDRRYIDKPQGVTVSLSADYWSRYTSGSLKPEEAPDQPALQAIKAWKANAPNDVIDRLIDATKAGQIERFVGQFDRDDLLRLLEECAQRVKEHSASNWEDGGHAPAIISVWRMCHRRNPEPEKLAAGLQRLMRAIVPTNLPLAQELKHYFTEAGGSVPALVGPTQEAAVRESMMDAFYASFLPSNTDALVRALRGGPPWVVLWMTWGLTRIRKGAISGTPVDRWPEVATLLLDLVERRPELGVPVVAPFVATSGPQILPTPDGPGGATRRVWVAKFDEAAAQALFDLNRLRGLLAQQPLPSDTSGQLETTVEAAIRWAKGMPDSDRHDPSMDEQPAPIEE